MSKANIHLFVSGMQVTGAGESINFGEADLAASAKAYDPKIHEAPLVIGHPKSDAPAYGWVQGLEFAENDGLTALPHQVNADFQEMFGAGAFKKVSARFYRPDSPTNPVPGTWYLRHIAFLGAQPPAVKGLRSPQLVDYSEADTDCITVDFAEPEPNKTPKKKPKNPPENDVSQKELDELRAANAKLEAGNTKLKGDLDASTAINAKAVTDRINEHSTSFAEQLVLDAKIGRDDAPLVSALLTHLQTPADDALVSFGEGDTAKPLHTLITGFLENLAPSVEFSEIATQQRAAKEAADDDTVQYSESDDKDAIELDKKIRAYMKKHKTTDYAAAARVVSAQKKGV